MLFIHVYPSTYGLHEHMILHKHTLVQTQEKKSRIGLPPIYLVFPIFHTGSYSNSILCGGQTYMVRIN